MSPSVQHSGALVWVADEERTWVKGVVKGHNGDMLIVSTEAGERQVPAAEAPLQNKDDEPVDDMTDLAFLHEPGVLWNLKQRYSSNTIYTYTGSILIAVNPFQSLPQLYGKSVMDAYSHGDVSAMAPHVYAIASAAYKKMRAEGKGQAILVTGESGAGKTETSKLIMRYLAYLGGFKQSCWDLQAAEAAAARAGSSSSIEQKVLESNPLLEAFGNAKTVRNDNSSRFGKYVEINFNARGSISGAAIRTYLLERSRLVHLNPGERNYHIFYQLCDGASAEEQQRWLLGHRTSYAYLNQSDVYELPGVCNATEFAHTRHAMSAIGITEQQQEDVFRILSALLHLGNISWEDSSHHSGSSGGAPHHSNGQTLCNGTAEAAAAAAAGGGCPLAAGATSPAALAAAASLMGVDVTGLARALSTRTRATPDGPITSPLDAKASAANRDALVKVIYARLFDWLVGRINSSIGQDPAAVASIGLLDIYGFESFQFNDLEQFCINLANEKLQQHFNQHVFKWEQAEYEAEGIDWSYIEFVDNQDVLDLIEGKLGVVDLLDEQCRFPTATYKDLADKLFSASNVTSSSRFSRTKRSTTAFTLSHYAGPVSYSLDNFLDKNKDFVVAEHQSLLGAAGLKLLTELFKDAMGGTESMRSSGGGASQNGKMGGLSGKSLKAFQFVSVCSHFKRQLAELMSLLHQLEPHYVRCIKPNPGNKPLLLDDGYALHQLKCGGVMEAVRISCAGYPFRRTFPDFLNQFWQLYPAGREAAASGDKEVAAAACRQLLATTGMSEGADYQVGFTKVFLKAHQSAYLNKLHTQALAAAATKIQAAWHGHKARKDYKRQRAAVIAIQAGVRGMFGRRKAAAVRRNRATTRIQADWRAGQARQAYKQLQSAALVLQCAARGAAARAAYQQELAEHRAAAATAIQAAWRGRQVRQQYKQDVAAVAALQAAWRGLVVRQQYAVLLQQSRSARTIQRAWRRHRHVKEGRFRNDQMAEYAAGVIQRIWRERDQHNSKVRRLQAAVRQYTELHRAVCIIQCAWRCHTARQQLTRLQGVERRARFKQQMAAFEQQMSAITSTGSSCAMSLSRSSSRHYSDSDTLSHSTLHPPGTMPPPQRAAYGVTFAGLANMTRSPSPGEPSTSGGGAGLGVMPRPPLATTTSTMKLRPLPPPPPAAYGVSYSGINGDINPIYPGDRYGDESGPMRSRNFKLYGPPPPAAYGVSYNGIFGAGSSGGGAPPEAMRARLLEPAPPAAYGVAFSGLQHMRNGSVSPTSSDYDGRSYSSVVRSSIPVTSMYRTPTPSSSASRLFGGLRRMGSTGKAVFAEVGGCGDGEEEDTPLLDVVKGDDSALLPPEDRLFVRLGTLVEEKGKVTNIMTSWKEKLLTK